MLYPDEPGKAKPNDEVHHWARLESKSDSMAEGLIQNMQSQKKLCHGAGCLANTLFFAVLITIWLGVAITRFWLNNLTEPPATSLSESSLSDSTATHPIARP
jgi:hypothetical protein